MIMKHSQGDIAARHGQSEQGEDRESTSAVHCETHHRESCSSFRSIQEPMQLSSRGKQMVWPSRQDKYREHRERDSRGREHQFEHCAQAASANGSILAEGNRHTGHAHRRSSSHHRDRCVSFSSAAHGAADVPAAGPAAAVPDNIQ